MEAGTVKTLLGAGLLFSYTLFSPSPLPAEEGGAAAPARRPNVVLITVNGLRPDHLGFSGYPRPTSPAADRLASTSFVFTRAFSSSGYTMPALMTLFTSLEPESHDVMDAFKDRLSYSVKTLPEVFQENGYATGGFFQTRHPHLDRAAGFGRGFDRVSDLLPNLKGRDEMLEWVRGNRDHPFLLFLNARNTHLPYLPPPQYKQLLVQGRKGRIPDNQDEFLREVYGRVVESLRTPGSRLYGAIPRERMDANRWLFEGDYLRTKLQGIYQLIPTALHENLGELENGIYVGTIDRDDPENGAYLNSLYDACVLTVDQEVLRPLLDLLKELGVRERTIVVLTADHGAQLMEQGILGTGTRFYEPMVRVPLVISVPGSSRREDIAPPVRSMDLMPTLLELCGLPRPPDLQGRSLVPLMRDPGMPWGETEIFGENRVWAFLRTGDWKLIIWRDHLHQPFSSDDELYDLAHDPEEKVNLCGERPAEYRLLRERIRKHLSGLPRYRDQTPGFPAFIDEETRKRIRETGYW